MARKERKFCGARLPNRTDGATCKMAAGARTSHPGIGRCYRHGGATPGQTLKAQREMAGDAVATYGLPRQVDPLRALLEEVWRTAGHVAWLELKVRSIDENALTWGTAKQTTERVVGGVERRESSDEDELESVRKKEEAAYVNVWLNLYRDERRHLVEVCKTAVACGLAERQVRIAEEQGAMIAQVIAGVLGDLGIDPKDPNARLVVRRHLMIAAGDAVAEVAV